MSALGFVIRPEYLDELAQKAPTARRERVADLRAAAEELDALERSFPERLRAARGGVETPRLSESAREWAEGSSDAAQEYHRLLLRRCRRADSDLAGVALLLESATEDLELTSFLAAGSDEDVAKPLLEELLRRKELFIKSLRDYLQVPG